MVSVGQLVIINTPGELHHGRPAIVREPWSHDGESWIVEPVTDIASLHNGTNGGHDGADGPRLRLAAHELRTWSP